MLKPGGRLVYATCSILPSENRAAIDSLLEKGGFTLVEEARLTGRHRLRWLLCGRAGEELTEPSGGTAYPSTSSIASMSSFIVAAVSLPMLEMRKVRPLILP